MSHVESSLRVIVIYVYTNKNMPIYSSFVEFHTSIYLEKISLIIF